MNEIILDIYKHHFSYIFHNYTPLNKLIARINVGGKVNYNDTILSNKITEILKKWNKCPKNDV